ncbi:MULTISPECIES: alpha/beta hydrolase [Rhodopseudomonas]|uniref:alpha/beta fold hydrolase n=1 Tax=Rhodopseudomonas sp. BAL398 TaxID=3034676 RepID=UPI001F431F73|nr:MULTISPECIES: alpha/beta hydrolase [Rhodopseudomonas]MDF3812973.1 alpha/beta hydrolase [Rhodopseudomonas sp. BAL398]WOK17492.1 alpha/beta hydrolase [Rhodopseudomonas sp. BAL398]
MRPGLANPLHGSRTDIASTAGRIATYTSGTATAEGPANPLLLIHSINAVGSAFEVKPLYDHYADKRPVHALDLPGFGQSDRHDREYTARMMTDAVHATVAKLQEANGGQPVDAVALSLSCEFIARAAMENPAAFRSLALISPTGFEGKARDASVPGNRGKPWLLNALNWSVWDRGIFRLLTMRPVIRKFLEKAWGSKNIDEALLAYDYETGQQPGARHAPYYFVAGYLFSTDALRVYESLQLPVWMAHGVRGDFVDYHHKDRVANRANWHIEQFETGAFPHFEVLDQVTRSYDSFLGALTTMADTSAASHAAAAPGPERKLKMI